MVTTGAADAGDDIASLWDKATAEPLRRAGCGRHLLSGAGINVDDLLAAPIDDVFSEYMPDANRLEQEA